MIKSSQRSLHLKLSAVRPMTLQPISMAAFLLLFSNWHSTPLALYLTRRHAGDAVHLEGTSPSCSSATIQVVLAERIALRDTLVAANGSVPCVLRLCLSIPTP